MKLIFIFLVFSVALVSADFLGNFFGGNNERDPVRDEILKQCINKYDVSDKARTCIVDDLRKTQGNVFNQKQFDEETNKFSFNFTWIKCQALAFATSSKGIITFAVIILVLFLICAIRSCLCC
ncbi:hypothetical protein PVAND_013772 [Polypedilum vanderplanki]|uniref:Uncharacterized protein n=1 Tax=Polypedilum vanderplanki TaxID=319348 RepID=A0A9J6CQE3_POLVA|nr:hypothetical protein PVAND_013772 [Polypedilum vanderplanki]